MDFIPVCEPFLNGNEKKYVLDAMETGWISSAGKYVNQFEERFAEYCGAKYAVSVCNGTSAIHLALLSLGIGKGDEVIIPNFTMIATAFAVCYAGASPVFVDADKNTWNINVNRIEEKITKNTKAIMPVSLFGQPCEMSKIWQLAEKYNLMVLEDAAESVGAEYHGYKTGNLADITAFSFFANKNITTGEGGMITTNNEELYKKARYYKNLCFPIDGQRNYIHEDIGYNYRMSNLHAAIGLAQVEKADYYKGCRINNAKFYYQKLKNVDGILFPEIIKNAESVFWMNAILVDGIKYGKSKDELMGYLRKNGVDSRLLFTGMHAQPSLRSYGCDCNDVYPETERLTRDGLYLPSGSNLTEEQLKYICNLITNYSR